MPRPALHSRYAAPAKVEPPGDSCGNTIGVTEHADRYREVIMFTTNPFIPLTNFVSPEVMQGYLVLMMLAVAIGTGFDLIHEDKAKFFLLDRKRAKAAAKRPLGGIDLAVIAARTLATDVATFGEFCNRNRRISHVLMFYGFVLYLVTTVAMVFAYPAETDTPIALPVLWNIGVLMTLVGGYWFFFLLRVNVVHDGQPPWRLVRADLFIVTLLASVTFALLFELAATAGNPVATRACAGLYVLFTTLLCISVPWSKFAHMFYKPVVAFQKRVEEADGSSDLPAPTTARGDRCPHSHT